MFFAIIWIIFLYIFSIKEIIDESSHENMNETTMFEMNLVKYYNPQSLLHFLFDSWSNQITFVL